MWFELRSVTAERAGVLALRDVSLSMEQGEVIGIIGANGAGKTTTLRAISGLTKLRAGEIWLDGERLDTRPHHKVVGLGVAHVPEGRRLFPDLTSRENLMMGAYLRRDRQIESDLHGLEEKFPILRSRAGQRAGLLSGGEQQIVAICRALMAKPRLLLLDEPSIGLAPRAVRTITDIVLQVAADYGIGVILVEQNARLALQTTARAYVLELGRVVASGVSKALSRDERVKNAYLAGQR